MGEAMLDLRTLYLVFGVVYLLGAYYMYALRRQAGGSGAASTCGPPISCWRRRASS